ncbi:galactokinase [Nesterenkonia muleiensis]|uniref:galactokinase n=1 Tax=Nesterenkonia muleiensis TaxID=2282648 RepID=UPI000E712D30|nr:galactokinase family protein [Nesterenkonia muleiensis]
MRDLSARWLTPGDPQSTSAALTSQFRQIYGAEPSGLFFAPGRANLNGEHIDFHGGRCLPMALPHGTYVAAAPRFDGMLRLRTLDPELDTGVVEIPDAAALPAPVTAPSWTTYVSGVLWALVQAGNEYPELHLGEGFGADLLICSTLPIGGGLSSSASLECAAALAFVGIGSPLGAEHAGEGLTRALTDERRAVLAKVCIRAEVEAVGAGTGGLDQNTALRAEAGKLVSLDCRDFSLQRTDLTALLEDYCFLAVDTGQPHELVDGQFAARRAEAEAAAAVLGVERLRDALPESPSEHDVELVLETFDRSVAQGAEMGGRDADACRRRLRHALTEMLRSGQLHLLFTALASGIAGVDHTAEVVGRIMNEGHASMRDYAEVSFTLADQVVDTVLSAGALGARLIGGGFGGSVLVLAPRRQVEKITTAAARLSPRIRFLAAIPSAPARVV